MSDLVIKPVLNEADLERCLKIRNDVFSIERNVPKEIEVDKFDCINAGCEHFLIQYCGEDIGTIRCMNISKTVIKVQRFCFYDKFRNNGFGKETMAYIEDYYRDKGKHKVELEAKFEVCGFYEKCGYEKVSDVFMEVGIKHVKMEKSLLKIRKATISDLDKIAELEQICFPKAEAASKESFSERLTYYANHFWLLEDRGKLISFVNGMVTDREHLTDEMYEKADMHNENGAWQMIFGVDTAPEYREKGYAGMVMKQVISEAREQGRKGLVLTCKDKLVHYYAKFGFVDEGVSESEHGGVVWHEMRLIL